MTSPPPTATTPPTGGPTGTAVPGHVAELIIPGETIEDSLTVKQGTIAVTPKRVVAVVYPNPGQTGGSTYVQSVIDRRSVRHVANGVIVDQGQQLLGGILCLAGMGGMFAAVNDSSNSGMYLAIGVIAIVIGAIIVYLAHRGSIVIFDETDTAVRIRLRRSELPAAAAFTARFGATLGG